MGGGQHDHGSPGARCAVRPTAAELEAAYGRTIPDVVADGLSVLFAGINPGLYSAATGYHFARPGNRFWPVLHRSGFTGRELRPCEQEEILRAGLGITNVVARATARAGELSAGELREGGRALADTVARVRPRWLAVVGVTAYRTAFGQPDAAVGSQNGTLGGAWLWVLPNPSGLNAHWGIDDLTAEFATLRRAAGLPGTAEPRR
jgi:double-stranded uracil-DNA glycosylase